MSTNTVNVYMIWICQTSTKPTRTKSGNRYPKTDNLPLAIITLLLQQSPVTSCLRVFDKWRRLRTKSRTDRDPTQFGHTCPWPGRTLPEVTISWTAQECTGCTGLGGTWQSGAPWLHERYPLQDWVKIHNWGSDLLELKIWFLSYYNMDFYGLNKLLASMQQSFTWRNKANSLE